MLQCLVSSPIPKVSEKKGATGQSFIRKEITSYRNGTLVFNMSVGEEDKIIENLDSSQIHYILKHYCEFSFVSFSA